MTHPLIELSTDAVAPGERLRLWGDAVWRLIGGLESDAFGDEAFSGRIVSGQAGYVNLCHLHVSRHRVVRTPGSIRNSDRAYLKVVAQMEGRACFEQDGRQVWLSPGEWSIYDTTRSYAVTNPGSVSQLVLMIPKDLLPERRLALDELMVQRFSGRSGVSRLAWDAMRSAFDELPGLSPRAGDGLADVITQLVQLALLERAGQPTQLTQREALRDRILHYIDRHLADPGLNVERVARALNCSRRHLYNAMSEDEETLAVIIQRRRLQGCARALADATQAQRPVTDIALAWGFSSSTHFSRAFRAHAGCSPSEYRARALERGAAALAPPAPAIGPIILS
ncbi:helix-turn-helix domain-containing protein [Melaminivora sp.]|uniref:AraC-like ligand-binding domain-containing protein n=1 Tax=Melaminivora sp. TaxID=1933032 RepID=UPI0028A62AA9|nr:helix-turn-helix domain-containing protein [Melaminivora sp.]